MTERDLVCLMAAMYMISDKGASPAEAIEFADNLLSDVQEMQIESGLGFSPGLDGRHG